MVKTKEVIKIPNEYISLPLERQELKDYLILLVEKERFLVEQLCGKRYSRKKEDFIRCKTQKKTILTKFGKVRHTFAYVKEKATGRTFSPLLEQLRIPPYQRLSHDFKQVLSRKASRSTYQLGVEDIEDSFGFGISRQTLHTYVKQTCSAISCISEPNPEHKILLADGTKVRNGKKTRHHEVRVLASYGEGNDKAILAQEINKEWQEIAKEIDFEQYKVLVADGETGIQENLCKGHMRFHLCHLHAINDVSFYLWKNGCGRKEGKPYINRLEQLLYTLQNSTKKYWRDKDIMRLARRVRRTKRSVKELADLLIVKGFVEAGEFLQRHVNHLTTASELAPSGLKVPFTTNGMERLMQEIGKRTKKKGMYWSEDGLQRILSMVLKRYVLPKNRRTYIEIFANNTREGIES